MKKFYLLFAPAFILTACVEPDPEGEVYIIKNSLETEVIHGPVKSIKQTEYENEQGSSSAKQTLFFTGDHWTEENYFQEFDSLGNLTAQTFYDADGVLGIQDFAYRSDLQLDSSNYEGKDEALKEVAIYNNKGWLVKRVVTDLRESRHNYVVTYDYDQFGRCTSSRQFYRSDGYQIDKSFLHDQFGRVSEKIVTYHDITKDYTTTFTRNEDGMVTQSEKSQFPHNDDCEFQEIRSYNEHGHAFEQKNVHIYPADDPDEVGFTYIAYEYDEQGNWIEKTYGGEYDTRFTIYREITYYE